MEKKHQKLKKIKKIVPLPGMASREVESLQGNYQLTYRGGQLLTSVEIFTIYWGKAWHSAEYNPIVTQMNKFFMNIVSSPLIDQLTEYNVVSQQIQHGTFVGTLLVNNPGLRKTVTDTTIQRNLVKWLEKGEIPPLTPNRLYFVFTQPGTTVKLQQDDSCQVFCGYHDHIAGQLFYAVIPYPECAGCGDGLSIIESMTVTASHEMCEAITDAVPGEGWYNDRFGEIGDYPCRAPKIVDGFAVQTEWSNAINSCI